MKDALPIVSTSTKFITSQKNGCPSCPKDNGDPRSITLVMGCEGSLRWPRKPGPAGRSHDPPPEKISETLRTERITVRAISIVDSTRGWIPRTILIGRETWLYATSLRVGKPTSTTLLSGRDASCSASWDVTANGGFPVALVSLSVS